MRNGGYVLDHRYFKTCGLQSADRSFSARAGALDEYFDGLQTMLHSGLCGSLSCGLSCEGVDFLLPRKPMPPADAQEIALPWVSVMVTMVLLKEELI